MGTLQQIIQKNTREIELPIPKLKRKGWITAGLIEGVNRKQKLYVQTKKYPNNKEHEKIYKTYKNRLGTIIQTVKEEYYNKLITDSKNSTKALWGAVKTATG